MKNRHLAIGNAFMHRTFYGLAELIEQGHGEEGDPGEPLKFKIYRDVPRVALCQQLPLALGDARWSFAEFRQQQPPAPTTHALTLEQLSQLLYYTYGFSRHDAGPGVAWPYHRLVPSARCFFPTELYLWLPEQPDLAAGIYHYDNLHHALALLRPGDYRDLLGRALGADLSDSLAVLFCSALFWKTAFRYRNFAYRLCTQEAGLVVGNGLMVGAALGLHGHVHYQFLDRPINQLLGLEPAEESVLAVVPLYDRERPIRRLTSQTTADALLRELPPLTVSHIKRGALDQQLCAWLTEIDAASMLEQSDEISTAPHAAPACAIQPRLVPTQPVPQPIELARALHQRTSGEMFFAPRYQPLDPAVFWEIIRYAVAPYSNDLGDVAAPPQLQLYLAVNHVAEIASGVYRYCPGCGGLDCLEERDVALAAQAIHSQPNVNCASANLVCYLVGSYPVASADLGNRAYRILHLESGLIAQRLCTMSAAFGLAARCSDSYHLDRCEELLGITGSGQTPLFQIVIGYERPVSGSRYKLAIHF